MDAPGNVCVFPTAFLPDEGDEGDEMWIRVVGAMIGEFVILVCESPLSR